MTQNANDILMGGGAAAKFPTLGAIVSGTITAEPTSSQQTNFRTKVPETWKDGSPKMQVLVQLQTDLRDPEKPNDDGARTLYIKGKELTNAIRQAVRATGANGLHTGGVLTVQYVGDGVSNDPNIDPPKLYAASYQPPATSFNGVTPPSAQPAQPAQQPAHRPIYPQQPAAPQVQPAQQITPQIAAPATSIAPPPPGVDPAMWAQLNDAQRAAVLAASAAQAAGPRY